MSKIGEVVTEIGDEIKAVWSEGKTFVEAEGKALWADVKPVVVSFLPDEYAMLKTAIVGVLQGAEDRSIEEVETAVLNLGTAEVALAKKVTSAVLQSVIALVIASGSTTQAAA